MVCKMACNLHTISRVFSLIKDTGTYVWMWVETTECLDSAMWEAFHRQACQQYSFWVDVLVSGKGCSVNQERGRQAPVL